MYKHLTVLVKFEHLYRFYTHKLLYCYNGKNRTIYNIVRSSECTRKVNKSFWIGTIKLPINIDFLNIKCTYITCVHELVYYYNYYY